METSTSTKLEVVSRSFLTRRRIINHVQTAVSTLYILVVSATTFAPHQPSHVPGELVRRLVSFATISLAYAFLAILARPAVHRLIRFGTPEHVQRRLPYGPLDATEIDGAPHSYGDLLRIWNAPSFRCGHQVNLEPQPTAPTALVVAPASLLYALAAAAIIGAAIVVGPWGKWLGRLQVVAAISLCLLVVASQISCSFVWRRLIRRRSFTVPSDTDLCVTSGVAVIITVVVTAVVVARAT